MAEHSTTRELALIDQAAKMLDKATSFKDIKSIRDKAESVRTYARAAKLGLELQNQAAEIKLRAERKAGGFLSSLGLRGGDRRSKSRTKTLNLEEIGINKNQSYRWQLLASVSERAFRSYVENSMQRGKEISAAGLLRIARQRKSGRGAATISVATSPVPHRDTSRERRNLGHRDNIAGDSLSDLQNHLGILIDLLEPTIVEPNEFFDAGQRHYVRRLLEEMEQLVREIREAIPSSADGNESPKALLFHTQSGNSWNAAKTAMPEKGRRDSGLQL